VILGRVVIMVGEVLGGKWRFCSGVGKVLWWPEKRHLFIGFLNLKTKTCEVNIVWQALFILLYCIVDGLFSFLKIFNFILI